MVTSVFHFLHFFNTQWSSWAYSFLRGTSIWIEKLRRKSVIGLTQNLVYCPAQPNSISSWLRLALFSILPTQPQESTETWNYIFMGIQTLARDHRKTTLLEDDLNRRLPQWKTASKEDYLNGRPPQWKTTSMETTSIFSNVCYE